MDKKETLSNERGKQELKIGDRVKVYDQTGNILFGGKTAIIIEKALLDPTEFYYGLYVEGETVNKFRGKGLLYLKNTATKIGKTALLAPFFAEDLELVKEPTDEIKVGDRVKTMNGVGVVTLRFATKARIDYLYNSNVDILPIDKLTKIEDKPTGKENNPNVGPITIPDKVDLDDTYWQHYREELTKEVAAKVAVSGGFDTAEDEADYVTAYVDRIVDNLKKNSE